MLQARYLGRCVAEMQIDRIVSSTMTRAIETAEIVHEKMPDVEIVQDELLCEVIPTMFPGLDLDADTVQQAKQQADKAFDKYFINNNGEAKNQLLVCHGNLIRYLICRSLRIPGEHWLQMIIHNCSLSRVEVARDELPALRSYNETVHMPKLLLSQAALRT